MVCPGHTAIGGRLGFESMSPGVTDMSECQDLMKCSVNGSVLPLGLGHWLSNGGILSQVEYSQRIPIKSGVFEELWKDSCHTLGLQDPFCGEFYKTEDSWKATALPKMLLSCHCKLLSVKLVSIAFCVV